MVELDYGNIYSTTGRMIQLRYAEKAVSRGSTILALRSQKGAVLVVSKPITSKLHVHENNHRVLKLSSNACIAYTGLLPTGYFIADTIKNSAADFSSTYRESPGASTIRDMLRTYTYLFTRSFSSRVLGASFLAILKDNDSEYRILGADSTGKVWEYHGFAYGAGERRAQTELENLHLDASTADANALVDEGIKILYKCFDPVTDLPFSIEVAMISDETDGLFARMDQDTVAAIAARHKDISVDNDE